ncbi:MAG TPA: tripartite tricarboxylate transporter substrate binding protein [Ramlibacter sp.]|nr:tripartite tricarboxylate transporter substrate binding protein [Ramlibacter sp.]
MRKYLGLLVTACALAMAPAMAQEFPRKQPIKIVVPVPAGGGTDVLARITAEFLQRRLGQSVVVENRPGASSVIGADYVAKSAPDGYTLLFVGGEYALLPAVRKEMPYKFDQMTYLVRPFVYPTMVFGSPKLPVNNTQELIAHMKANPGKVRYGSTGVGAIVHLGVAMLESAAGVKGVHVPYPGIAPVYQDLLAGNLDFTIASLPAPDGLKILGASGTKRNPLHPNLPTLDENGIKGASWDVWFGLFGPPNLPKPIADRLIAEVTAVLKDPEAIAKYQSAAKASPEANPLTGEEFKRATLQDNRNWKAVVDREKIVIQQ